MECSLFTVPSQAYPRFHHFRDRLLCVQQRFTRVIESGAMETCVHNGKKQINEISAALDDLKPCPQVIVLGDHNEVAKKDVTKSGYVMENVLFTKERRELGPLLKKPWTQYQPSVIVYQVQLAGNNWHQSLQKARNWLAELGSVQTQDAVLCIRASPGKLEDLETLHDSLSKERHAYRVIFPQLNIPHPQDGDTLVSQSQVSDQPLCEVIQEILEPKAIRILERIYSLILSYAQKNNSPSNVPEQNLLKEITMSIRKVLKDPVMMKELYEVANSNPDSTTVLASAEEFFQAGGSNDSNTFKTLMGRTSIVEPDEVKSQSEVVAMETDNEKDKEAIDIEFKKQLLRHLYNVTRCVVISYLSDLFSLPLTVVTELLTLFGFEDQFLKHADLQCLPEFYPKEVQEVLQGKRKRQMGGSHKLSEYLFIKSISEVIHKVEDFVKEKAEIVDILRKMDYEIAGLLRETKVPLTVQLDMLPGLPPSLQKDILRLQNVVGCGRIYGKLVIHVTSDPILISSKLAKTLREHHYFYSPEVQKVCPDFQQQANVQIEAGKRLRSKRNDSRQPQELQSSSQNMSQNQFKYGTLGCFVNAGDQVYALTCAHVVEGCNREVHVELHPKKYKDFCRLDPKCIVSEGVYDIAALQILDEEKEQCMHYLKNRDGLMRTSVVYEGDVLSMETQGKQVFKWGAQTDYTCGIIVSSDYKKARIDQVTDAATQDIVDSDYSILVEPLPGNTQPFSEEGDSGSIICALQLEADAILAIGIVNAGAFRTTAMSQKKFEFSVISLLHSSLEKVSLKSGLQFTWPTFSDDDILLAGLDVL